MSTSPDKTPNAQIQAKLDSIGKTPPIQEKQTLIAQPTPPRPRSFISKNKSLLIMLFCFAIYYFYVQTEFKIAQLRIDHKQQTVDRWKHEWKKSRTEWTEVHDELMACRYGVVRPVTMPFLSECES
jgi:hypothetical protein